MNAGSYNKWQTELMNKRNILVAGATGFLGRELIRRLAASGHHVSAFYRNQQPQVSDAISWIKTGDLGATPIDASAGKDIDVFINLAAPLRPTSQDQGGVASQSASIARNISDFILRTDIRKIIVMSSIAASVAEKDPEHARRYGIEKLAADHVFSDQLNTKCQLIILRPPAIYGEGMKGSMQSLVALVRKNLPIPLGLATATRHYISTGNICHLIKTITASEEQCWEAGAGQTFEPSDGQQISTRELVQMIAETTGHRALLLPFPLPILRALGAALGRPELVSGAIDPLEMAPSTKLESIFGWRPSEQMPDSLAFLADELNRA